MGGDVVSNRKYYLDHKDEINRRKRERYKKDKEYRHAALRRAKSQTLIKKVQRIAERSTVKHGKYIEQVYTLAELCKAINRSKDVIFRWRKSGVMPKPTHYRGSKGVYSTSQLAYMKIFCERIDAGDPLTYQSFSEMLKKVWNKGFSLDLCAKEIGKHVLKALSKKGAGNGKAKGSV